MKPRVIPLVPLALLVAASSVETEDLSVYVARFAIMNPELGDKDNTRVTRPHACYADDTKQFWSVLKALQSEQEYGRKLRGKASLGFRGDDTRASADADGTSESPAGTTSQYTLSVGLKLRRGTYPGEFKFDAGVDVQLQDRGDTFSQNVRDIYVAYDYYPNPYAEAFVFGNLFTDNFMSIDQRYEVGAGVFLGKEFGTRSGVAAKTEQLLHIAVPQGTGEEKLGSGNTDTRHKDEPATQQRQNEAERQKAESCKAKEEAQERKHRLKTWSAQLKEARKGSQVDHPSWLRCYAEFLGPGKEIGALADVESFLNDISGDYDEAFAAQNQRTKMFRTGAAFSVFGELEHATVKAPPAPTQADPADIRLPATQRYRWVVRPTVEFKPTQRWELRADWYFKLPLNDAHTVIPGESAPRYDFRYDLDITAVFRADEKELGQPGTIEVGIRYRRLFDNVPPFSQSEDPEGVSHILVAPDTHSIVTVDFGIRW